MLSQISENIAQLDELPPFRIFYQDYVRKMEDRILENELALNEGKMIKLKNYNCVLTQLNELTEELKGYEKLID